MDSLRRFMAAATTAQQEALARASSTSRSYLYALSSGTRTASADLAADIERGSKKLRRAHTRLPLVLRTDLCPACARCELVKHAQ